MKLEPVEMGFPEFFFFIFFHFDINSTVYLNSYSMQTAYMLVGILFYEMFHRGPNDMFNLFL